jgi:subtilisin family serine protease
MKTAANLLWRICCIVGLATVLPHGHAMADAVADKRKQVAELLSAALEKNAGYVEIAYRGVPNPKLIEVVLAAFAKKQLFVRKGVSLAALTQVYCGYQAPAHTASMVSANVGKINDKGIVTGNAELVELQIPACLVGPTISSHLVSKGESATTLAQKYYSSNVASPEFCVLLLAANNRTICADSASSRLQDTDRVDVPDLARLKVLENRQERSTSILRIVSGTQPADLAKKLVASLEQPQFLNVRPLSGAQPIVPVQNSTCPVPVRPFDPNAVVEAFFRPALKKNGKSMYDRVVKGGFRVVSGTIGILDTGLYGAVDKRVAADARRSFVLLANAGEMISKSMDGSNDIEPSSGDKYEGHGTHVYGLTLGGGTFWRHLVTSKVTNMFASLPDLAFVKVTSDDPDGNPVISSAVIGDALNHLRKSVDIINFSHKAMHSPTVKREFMEYAENQKIVVSAAGNDGLINYESEYNSTEPLLSAMLTGTSIPFFITVAAADETLTKPAPFSNTSTTRVDLFAPGTCIESWGTGPRGVEFVSMSGTSQAAPLVTFTASLLRRMMMPPKEIKLRILDTVDYGKGFESGSIAGGVLNVAKALDYFDDIVVRENFSRSEYARGRLVSVIDKDLEAKDFRICDTSKSGDALALQATLRDVRRIVVTEDKLVKLVLAKTGDHIFYSCSPNLSLRLRLKEPSRPNDFKKDFGLLDLREIVPRPVWLPQPLQ